jgi:hypothetical protein
MTNDNPTRDHAHEDAQLLALYRSLGSPLGDDPDGFARWLVERLGTVNQDRRKVRSGPWGGPINDPRVKRGG